jgi:hypothetical protein
MAIKHFKMDSRQIAEIMGTVGSPLIVIAELIKNAVDASAKNILVSYDLNDRTIVVENDYKGLSINEIENLYMPGISEKKNADNLKNENGMFLTGSKGLGLLSVFLLCNKAAIITTPKDQNTYKILLNKETGTVDEQILKEEFERHFTRIILQEVDIETIRFLSSEPEVRKLRHICTNLYKSNEIPFPQMTLHINNQEPVKINFLCKFPPMLYDINFSYNKNSKQITFCLNSPNKAINSEEVIFTDFSLNGLEKVMLEKYKIKYTIPTRTNTNFTFSNFDNVPSFEGRILVYERNSAGSQLRTYGAGVNVYINDFALYNYLAEENDWLGLADYSQRKKNTRVKPHTVFGYVNFPSFNENKEALKISNERADFIQDTIFRKLLYLLKGVVMFSVFNIDVADKNPSYKVSEEEKNNNSNINMANDTPPQRNSNNYREQNNIDSSVEKLGNSNYTPESLYKPKKNIPKNLIFTKEEGNIIDRLNGVNDLGNKIYNIVFELSKLDLQVHRYSITFLYRALLESATKYYTTKNTSVIFVDNSLEAALVKVINYLSKKHQKGDPLSIKTIQIWGKKIKDEKLIDSLNQYIHHEHPIDAHLIIESWNSMKGYIIKCLSEI